MCVRVRACVFVGRGVNGVLISSLKVGEVPTVSHQGTMLTVVTHVVRGRWRYH